MPLPLWSRRRYERGMTTDPFALFADWYVEARATEPNDSNAMALATVGADGQPSLRMVLLKGHGPEGFTFYTNRESRKAGELEWKRPADQRHLPVPHHELSATGSPSLPSGNRRRTEIGAFPSCLAVKIERHQARLGARSGEPLGWLRRRDPRDLARLTFLLGSCPGKCRSPDAVRGSAVMEHRRCRASAGPRHQHLRGARVCRDARAPDYSECGHPHSKIAPTGI